MRSESDTTSIATRPAGRNHGSLKRRNFLFLTRTMGRYQVYPFENEVSGQMCNLDSDRVLQSWHHCRVLELVSAVSYG